MSKFNLLGLGLILSLLLNLNNAQFSPANINCILGNWGPLFCSWTTILNNHLEPNSQWSRGGPTNRYLPQLQYGGPLIPSPTKGFFIKVYNPASPNPINDDLITPTLNPKTTTDCFSFEYYIFNEHVGFIQLNIVTGTVTNPIWTVRSQDDMWYRYSVNIGPQKLKYQLQFLTKSKEGGIGLANLVATPGLCSPQSICDFESGNCNWTSTYTNPNYQFKLTKANSTSWSSSKNNEADHTTESVNGHFMEASEGQNGDVTNLTSPVFTGYSSKYCLRFWFWRHSSQYNKIDVLINSTSAHPNIQSIWETSYNYPFKIWQRAQVNLSNYSNMQIIIRATHLANTSSPVDIDDIILVPGSCPPVIECNFDTDMCGWTRDTTQNLKWDHGLGRVKYSKGLHRDYVVRSHRVNGIDRVNGLYMYTDFTSVGSGGGKMIMMSEFVPATSASCLTFYYLPLSFNNENSQFQVILRNNDGKIISTLFVLGNVTSSIQWKFEALDIKTTQPYQIVLEVTKSSPSTYIAVDNIKFRVGTCASYTSTPITTKKSFPTKHTKKPGPFSSTHPPTSTVMPITFLSCDFESETFCNWVNNQTNKWKLNSVSDLMPRADHTSKSISGHFAYLSHETEYTDPLKTAVMSITDNNQVGKVGPVCFTLWYYMRTKGEAQLNITVKAQNKFDTYSRDHDHGDKWNKLQFEINDIKNGLSFNISALAKKGVVAIDDITVEYRIC